MRLILVILLIWATAAHAAGPQEGPDGAMLVRVAKSVVQVISTGCPGEEGDLRSGSGFVLGNDSMIVTDLHVVAGCASYQVKYPGIDERPATVARVLMARDLALLKVDQPPPMVPALQLAKTTPQVKEELEVIGFPLGLPSYDNASLHVTLATQITPVLRDGLDQQTLDQLKSVGFPALDTQVVRVDGHLLPGDSGAPLIDYQGNVAGIGDGGLERGTVGVGWATLPQYVNELLNSNEPPPSAQGGVASVAFATTIPSNGAADRTVKCGTLSLTRRRGTRLATLIKTSDDPVKLGKLLQDLTGAPVEQFDDEHFSIWTEPKSGAGIALPKELHIVSDADHCTVHTGAPDIDYDITLVPLPFDATTAEWQLDANRQNWLAGHRDLAAANTNLLAVDPKYSSQRFENGGIVTRYMKIGQTKDLKSVRVFTSNLSGRGAFVSISVINRDVKADSTTITDTEKLAWARGLLAVYLTAFPPVQEAAAGGQDSTAVDQASGMVWPGPRNYPQVRCGDSALIQLSQPRALADLLGFTDLDTVLRAVAGSTSAAISRDLFDVWVQPLKGAVVLLPHGLKPAGDRQVCRIPSPSPSIGFTLRVFRPPFAGTREEGLRRRDAETQAFVRYLEEAVGGRFQPDPSARFQARIDPNGFVNGSLLIGNRPDGTRESIYVVRLWRDQISTFFAMTDTDVKAPGAMAPADLAALAQGLAAVRLSTLLPPEGFLTAARGAGQ
jgi:S1-C subfamily serine protease